VGPGRARADLAAGADHLSRARSGIRRHRGTRTGGQLDRPDRRLASDSSFSVRAAGVFVSGDAGVCRLARAQGPGSADARSRINTVLRAAGFVLTLLTSCGLATLHWDGSACRTAPAACSATSSATGSCARLELSRRDAAAAGSVVRGRRAVPWRLVVRRHGRSARARCRRSNGRAKRSTAPRTRLRPAAQAGAPGSRARGAEEGREPAAAAHRGAGAGAAKSERVERERQVPLFDAPKSSELPALSLLDEPGRASSRIRTRRSRRCRAWSN
jgi:hypothetical protein